MIFAFLWRILKFLLVICGIIITASITVDLIKRPFENRKRQKNINEFLDAINNAVEEAIIELEKEEKEKETKKKSTKKTTKKKDNF